MDVYRLNCSAPCTPGLNVFSGQIWQIIYAGQTYSSCEVCRLVGVEGDEATWVIVG